MAVIMGLPPPRVPRPPPRPRVLMPSSIALPPPRPRLAMAAMRPPDMPPPPSASFFLRCSSSALRFISLSCFIFSFGSWKASSSATFFRQSSADLASLVTRTSLTPSAALATVSPFAGSATSLTPPLSSPRPRTGMTNSGGLSRLSSDSLLYALSSPLMSTTNFFAFVNCLFLPSLPATVPSRSMSPDIFAFSAFFPSLNWPRVDAATFMTGFS
mmetsp:Transcript_8642/g.27127  ORF Transcript_8642/g.27127 Transcript_8642/m.27127 type:complete len:214 (-) Transcript_8642:4685-5326(-)